MDNNPNPFTPNSNSPVNPGLDPMQPPMPNTQPVANNPMPVNQPQPMMQPTQPNMYNPNVAPAPKKMDKGLLITICVVAAAFVIGLVIVLIVVLSGGDNTKGNSGNNSQSTTNNQYESDENSSTSGNTTGNGTTSPTISCLGYSFNKVANYSYTCADSKLAVFDSMGSFTLNLQTITGAYSSFAQSIEELVSELRSTYQLGEYGTWNSNSGKNYLYFQFTPDNARAGYIVITGADNTESFMCAFIREGSVTKSDLSIVAEIVENSDISYTRLPDDSNNTNTDNEAIVTDKTAVDDFVKMSLNLQ